MAWLGCSSRFTILTVALSLGFAVSFPTQTFAQSTSSSLSGTSGHAFRAPRTETSAPDNTAGGGTRGPDDQELDNEQEFEEISAHKHEPGKLSPDEASTDNQEPEARVEI